MTSEDAPATPAGWYADPHGQASYRYWDGAAWTDRTSSVMGKPLSSPSGGGSPAKVFAAVGAGLVLVFFAFWYFTGNLDKPLSEVNLNWTECVQAAGETYCGDDAESLKLRRQLQDATDAIRQQP